MRIVTVAIAFFAFINLVYGEDGRSIKIEQNVNSVKTKRGIHGFSSGLRYSIPYYAERYTPYAKFPGIYKGPISPTYTLNPGNAVTHSFNVNYPKVFIPRPAITPVLYHAKPILPAPSVPIYATSFPIFQPTVIHRVPLPSSSLPHIHYNIQSVSPIPQPNLISQDGWRPIFSSVPSVIPSSTILPPSISPQITTSGGTQPPNNYYLPPRNDAALGNGNIIGKYLLLDNG